MRETNPVLFPKARVRFCDKATTCKGRSQDLSFQLFVMSLLVFREAPSLCSLTWLWLLPVSSPQPSSVRPGEVHVFVLNQAFMWV